MLMTDVDEKTSVVVLGGCRPVDQVCFVKCEMEQDSNKSPIKVSPFHMTVEIEGCTS